MFVYFWAKRAAVRALLERGSALVLAGYIVFLATEVAMELVGRPIAIQAPTWVRLAFWAFIAVALFSKLREWGEHRQELYFIESAKALTEILSSAAVNSGDDLELRIGELLRIFRRNFSLKRALNANLSVMCPDDRIRVKLVQPATTRYDSDVALAPGEGGAGYCYENQCAVYIPYRRLGHAIIQEIWEDRPYSMVEDLYVDCNVQEFHSILSVPVSAYGRRYGVLNFDSAKRNAFRRIDFQQAMFYGFALAQLLHAAGDRAMDSLRRV